MLGLAMQQRANWIPVIVSNRDLRTEGVTNENPAGEVISVPTCSAFHITCLDGSFVDTTKVLDRTNKRRTDLRFAVGVALALALPAFIGLGVYIAAESIILRAS